MLHILLRADARFPNLGYELINVTIDSTVQFILIDTSYELTQEMTKIQRLPNSVPTAA